jgi:hypothetical protein
VLTPKLVKMHLGFPVNVMLKQDLQRALARMVTRTHGYHTDGSARLQADKTVEQEGQRQG